MHDLKQQLERTTGVTARAQYILDPAGRPFADSAAVAALPSVVGTVRACGGQRPSTWLQEAAPLFLFDWHAIPRRQCKPSLPSTTAPPFPGNTTSLHPQLTPRQTSRSASRRTPRSRCTGAQWGLGGVWWCVVCHIVQVARGAAAEVLGVCQRVLAQVRLQSAGVAVLHHNTEARLLFATTSHHHIASHAAATWSSAQTSCS